MIKSTLFGLGLLALRTSAQQTITYSDDATGITFQGYTSTAGMTVGIAVSEDATSTDFIGQIIAPVTQGYAGISLTGRMANALLVVAYPNGEDIVSSLREASTYANPRLFDGADAVLKPIVDGTYVNSTAFVYTFLCSKCILDDGKTFTMATEAPVLAWVMSHTALSDPSSTDAVLNYHSNFGTYDLSLASAKSASFETWAALASDPTTAPSGPGNGTTPPNNGTTTVSNTTYDYIIAGGGASGIIVAERIAEAGFSVLLLERGPASTYASGGDVTMPWNDTVTAFDVPGVSWYISSIEGAGSKFCSDTAGQAGCVLGGGSSVNCVLWMKPPARDFDDKWPTGWKWDDVSAAADRLYERNPGQIQSSMDGKYYDQAAYEILSQHFSQNGWTNINAIADTNSKHQVFSHTPYSVQDGLRAGPVKTYLPLAKKLPNFTLQLNSEVIRAVRTNATITGVEIEFNQTRQIINLNAGGRVILASGTLSTPRILFRSGIGPSEQIQNVVSGTKAVTLPDEAAWITLPVGKRTQDHSVWQFDWNLKPGMAFANLTSLSKENLLNPTAEMTDLFAQGSGPLAQGNPRMDTWTSITNADGSVRYVQSSWWAGTNDTIHQVMYLTHGSDSSGVLGISTSGLTEFTVTPWLTTDGDREACETFVGQMLEYSRKNGSLLEWPVANATAKDLIADPASAGTHYVGSARMGTSDGRLADGTDVVDLDTKVYGTDNLYVVDASIHPDLPTGNTQAIVMVVAEKAAEKILALKTGAGPGSSNTSPALPNTFKRDVRRQTQRVSNWALQSRNES